MWIDWLRLAPLLVFIYFGARLSLIDWKSHRLPNRLVAISIVGILMFQLAFCLAVGDFTNLSQAGLAAVKVFSSYVVLFLLSGGQLGLGDVKFAIPNGLILGWYFPEAWLISIIATFLLAGLVSLLALSVNKIDRKSHIPLGPFMYFGSIIALFLVNLLAQ